MYNGVKYMAKPKKKSKSSSKQSSKWMFWVIGVLSLCIVGLIFLGNFSKKEADFDYKGQPYIGKQSAPVQIVEFGDYKCPVCKNFNESFVPQIQKEFVDTGKAKFYFMNYPFINVDSTRSALFAETVYKELGNEAFWKFHELLYKKQPDDAKYEKMDVYTESFLTAALKEVANNEQTEKVVQAFQKETAKSALDKDTSFADKIGINATPTLFINGKKFKGNTFDDFKKMVEEAAKEKK
jgi:protein-disulfide isomerase